MFRKLLLPAFIVMLAFGLTFSSSQENCEKPKDVPAAKFLRGGWPTPIARIINSLKSGKSGIFRPGVAAPAQVIVVPKRTSNWGTSVAASLRSRLLQSPITRRSSASRKSLSRRRP